MSHCLIKYPGEFSTKIAKNRIVAPDVEGVLTVGDDLGDLKALLMEGVSCLPSDAFEKFRSIVDVITAKPGGNGSAREVCDAFEGHL